MRILLILAIFVLSLSPVYAGDLEDARAAIATEHYGTALTLLEPLAQQGDSRAQNELGHLYRYGWGVRRDAAEAAGWYRMAAEQGHPEAQINLGLHYLRGLGVERDPAEATRWFRLAAEQGDADGQEKLGMMYSSGTGVERDPSMAFAWFLKAAGQGSAHSQWIVGSMYERGEGVAPNEEEALKWYRKAAAQGDPKSKARIKALTTTAEYDATGEPNLDVAMAATADVLARSYLFVKYMTEFLLPAAQSGATVHIPGETITMNNVEEYKWKYNRRLSIYKEAITRRGYRPFSGTYRARTTESCARIQALFLALIQEGSATGIEIIQDDFEARLVVSAEYEGKELSLENPAAVVESSICVCDAGNSAYYFRGEMRDGNIELRPDADVLNSWPSWAGPPSREDLENCTITLERRPDDPLE